LAQLEPASSAAVPLLALLVDVYLAADDVDRARDAADRLAKCARVHPTDYLKAHAALARGQICVAEGDREASACLRDALAGFELARLPMESARARLAFAGALAADRPNAAVVEAKAALQAFERLQAAREADAAASTLRALGARVSRTTSGTGVLSAREADVLELLGHGLSNPEIAARLYISRKTVEHHVSNILAKLDLRSRAEAAAYATRGKPAVQ
jgi:DNA-binding NarL/FixJ family response regulator